MKCITSSTYPAKVVKSGKVKYVAIPANVLHRMGLEEGDLLDVTISFPKMEEYDMETLRSLRDTDNTNKRSRRESE
jgi:antitoxin component of MazEF toxin-antitoxin module